MPIVTFLDRAASAAKHGDPVQTVVFWAIVVILVVAYIAWRFRRH